MVDPLGCTNAACLLSTLQVYLFGMGEPRDCAKVGQRCSTAALGLAWLAAVRSSYCISSNTHAHGRALRTLPVCLPVCLSGDGPPADSVPRVALKADSPVANPQSS